MGGTFAPGPELDRRNELHEMISSPLRAIRQQPADRRTMLCDDTAVHARASSLNSRPPAASPLRNDVEHSSAPGTPRATRAEVSQSPAMERLRERMKQRERTRSTESASAWPGHVDTNTSWQRRIEDRQRE